MWGLGICLLLTFFAFRGANHAWAAIDTGAQLHLYPTAALWCFFPGFAAISIPWPFTVWLLSRIGRTDEADAIMENSNLTGGYDSFKILKWISIGLVLPIGILTLLAIPIHMSISKAEVRVGHFASLRDEVFPLAQASRATLIDGIHLTDGTLRPQKDLLVDFIDGRRLRANQVGDGGTNADPKAVELLLKDTGLKAQRVTTPDDISRR